MESKISFLVSCQVGGWVGWWLGELMVGDLESKVTKGKVEVEVVAELGKNIQWFPVQFSWTPCKTKIVLQDSPDMDMNH